MPAVRTDSLDLHLQSRVGLFICRIVPCEGAGLLVVQIFDNILVTYGICHLASCSPSCRQRLFAGIADTVGRNTCNHFREGIDTSPV